MNHSHVRHGAANLFKARSCAVLVTPAFDVRPVEFASLDANDGADVYSFDVDGPLLFKKEHVLETTVSSPFYAGRRTETARYG